MCVCVFGHATDQSWVEGVMREWASPQSTGDRGRGHGHGQWLAGCLSGSNALLAWEKENAPHGRVNAGQRRGDRGSGSVTERGFAAQSVEQFQLSLRFDCGLQRIG